MINSMLITSWAPHSLWGEVCLAANTILNKIPHKKSDKTPYQLWKGKQPFYKRMKVWGCLAKVQIPLPKRFKLGPKIVDCVYLGPAKNSVAYRFLVYKSNIEDISNNTIIGAVEAEFFKKIIPYKDKDKQISNPRKRVIDNQLSQDQTDNNFEDQQENVEPRRSKRAKVTKDFGPNYMTHIVNEEPQAYKAAMESSEAPYWKEAIQSEIDSIVHNNTWKLVDLPSGHKLIGHKWIFKKKLRPNGTIEKYKARLVAKGYHDMLIMGTNMDVTKQTKKMLHSSFDMKDMGEADVILDLAYSVSRLSRYSHNPDRDHWDALVRVLQYLKHTTAYGLHYTKYPSVLEGYCDANWISHHNEGKSTSGYVFILGGDVVSWKSSKQTVNTRSTMEAKFVALDKAAEEAKWLRSFLEGIPLWPKSVTAVCIHCDSMATLTRAKNHIYNRKSRHIRRRHNTIKDLLRNGIISINYVKSKEYCHNP
ncbi:DNA polymerase zeta catalytic subunit-like protein [Tanacetum coccineum]